MVDESDEDVKERLANQTEHAKTKEEDTKWIILELHDDNAFRSILRILHRHSSCNRQ